MRSIVVLVVGLVLGFVGRDFFLENPKAVEKPVVSNSEPTSCVAAPEASQVVSTKPILKSLSHEKTSPPSLAPKKVDLSKRTLKATFERLKASGKIPKRFLTPSPKAVKSLRIDDVTITALEENWGDLRNQAEMYFEAEGWRIKRIQPQSHFSKVGFKQGDLIHRETLRASTSGSANDDDLVYRLEKILDHVAQ